MNRYIIAGMFALSMGAASLLTSCSNDDPVINTTPIIKSVVTGSAEVTATSAVVSGSIDGLKGQNPSSYTVGVVYSTNENPTAGGSNSLGALGEDGSVVTAVINALQPGVTYYYATYVTLQGKVTEYGDILSFYTTDAAVGTAAPASVTAVSANLGGTLNGVQDKIDAGTLDYGIVIAPQGVALQDGVMLRGEGTTNTFNIKAEGLVPNTTYTYAAYMVINNDVEYGNEQTLQTPVGINYKDENADIYVDMGTKLEWCKYNVGSLSETDPGAFIGYGDVASFNYSTDLSNFATGDITRTDRDAAAVSMMGMTPTLADWNELLSVCDVTESASGIKLTSTVTGNSIFLPAAGKREGASFDGEGKCFYWTGTASETNGDYAMLYCGSNGMQKALRSTGALVRPVRKKYIPKIEADASKLVVGDIEGNGRIRIEIYNEWGDSKENCCIDISQISFEKQMVVNFTIEGINDNLKEGAIGSYRAGLQYSDPDWWPGYWSGYNGDSNDCIVSGDGSYSVKFDTPALTEGAVVFCLDIDKLGADLVDPSLIKVTALNIQLDPEVPCFANVPFGEDKAAVLDKDGGANDLRIEFFNEWGPTNDGTYPFDNVTFGQGTTTVSLSISGIDGNLKDGAAGSYNGSMILVDKNWWPGAWGGGASTQTITGDGDYNFQAYLEADAHGVVIWYIDIADLWIQLVDPSLVKVKVNGVVTPVHPE